jgi:hypothetical protein
MSNEKEEEEEEEEEEEGNYIKVLFVKSRTSVKVVYRGKPLGRRCGRSVTLDCRGVRRLLDVST